MTTSKPTTTTENPFLYLIGEQYISLKTFRKNGTGVATPVWFAARNEKLYVVTTKETGKVKRINNTSRVTLAPCDQRGNISGSEVEAQARELTSDEYVRANTILQNKYGVLYRIFGLVNQLRKDQTRTFLEITPASNVG